jgi:hypothetical protein
VTQFADVLTDHIDHPLAIFVAIVLAAGYLTRNVMVPLIGTRREASRSDD